MTDNRQMGPRGAQGDQGNPGERGEPGADGLSTAVRRALVYLFVTSLVLSAAALFAAIRIGNSNTDAISAAQHREQAAQQHAGLLVEQKLCATFSRLAANEPPPGNPRTNPSRRYDQENHAILVQLGADIGCKPGGAR